MPTVAGLEHKIGNVYVRRGEWDAAETHFRSALAVRAESREGSARGEEARVYADWSLVAHRRGQHERAVKHAQRALELAQGVDDRRALAQAHNILGVLARSRGDLKVDRQVLKQVTFAAKFELVLHISTSQN